MRLRYGMVLAVIVAAFLLCLAAVWLWPASGPPAYAPGPMSSSPVTPASTGAGEEPSAAVTPSPTTRPRKVPASPTARPPARQTDPDVVPSYRSCIEVRLDHPAGVQTGHPAYRSDWDLDHDGWACDPPPEVAPSHARR